MAGRWRVEEGVVGDGRNSLTNDDERSVEQDGNRCSHLLTVRDNMLYTLSIIALVALVAMGRCLRSPRRRRSLPLSSLLPPTESHFLVSSDISHPRWLHPSCHIFCTAAQGLTSSNFDIERNNLDPLAGDSRLGLDEAGAREVHEIMDSKVYSECSRMSITTLQLCSRFDEARLIRHKRILAAHGIDPSGILSSLSLCGDLMRSV